MKYRSTKIIFVGINSLLFCNLAFGRPLSKLHVDFYDYFTSPDFNNTVSMHILKPGTLSAGNVSPKAMASCLITTTFTPRPGVDSEEFTAVNYCLARDGVCEDPLQCAKRLRADSTPTNFNGRDLPIAVTGRSKSNRHGDTCRETPGQEEGLRGTIQLLVAGKSIEEGCVTYYSCVKKPTEIRTAACPVIRESVKNGNRASDRDACPQLNDCINTDVLLPGFTQDQLNRKTLGEREDIRKAYELAGTDKDPRLVTKETPNTRPTSATTSVQSGTPTHKRAANGSSTPTRRSN